MTAEQAAALKRLTLVTYELDAFKPNLTRTEADIRIAMLTAKLSKACFDQAGFRFCFQALPSHQLKFMMTIITSKNSDFRVSAWFNLK